MQLCTINAVESDAIAFAVSETTFCNQQTGAPETMIIRIATDQAKARGQLDIPVYLPAANNFKSASHFEMLNLFKNGDPFVAVEFYNLLIHLSKDGYYYGLAHSFSVVTQPYERLEELL
jgi:hypothetical protein